MGNSRMTPGCRLLAFGLSLLTAAAHAQDPQRRTTIERLPPVAPELAERTFRSPDGFRLQLLAAEPLVADPVALEYDENGLAWVAEMADYPYSDKSLDRHWEDQPSLPLGRIRILEDTDGDGRFDKSTVFAEDLSWPTGLAFWKGGVFVAATPDILYLKDTDGDRRADFRETVFTGFRKYNVQAVINNLKWGLDHHIYGAGSSNGGTIHTPAAADASGIVLGRNDFRFDPLSRTFAVQTGGARFGNSFDDWGNRFISNIRNPVQHVVMDPADLSRNRILNVPTGLHDAAEAGIVPVFRASPPEPWRVVSAARRANDPEDPSPESEKAAVGYITSASGATVYRGDNYPEEYSGNIFVGEVAGNLIMRYRLIPSGPTFRAVLQHGDIEFLASTDTWFRPVNFANAPDGTLHVVDMYRETIEHPWSIPDDIREQLDLRSGHDRGRIYRLLPPGHDGKPEGAVRPRLGDASVEELVRLLESRRSWFRETAARLLFERQDPAAVVPLRTLMQESRVPLARMHAMWALQGLHALSADDVHRALDDPHPGVREHALRLAGPFVADSGELRRRIVRTADDADPRIRFRAVLLLGLPGFQDAEPTLTRRLRHDGDDPWLRAAALSALTTSPGRVFADLWEGSPAADREVPDQVFLQLAAMVGARNDLPEIRAVLQEIAVRPAAASREHGVLQSIALAQKSKGRSLNDLVDQDSPGGGLVRRFLQQARESAIDAQADVEARTTAISRLAFDRYADVQPLLTGLIDSRQPVPVQRAAVVALGNFAEPQIAQILLDRYRQVTPDVRREIAQTMMARTDRVLPLFRAIDQGLVARALVPDVRRTLYMKSPNPEIRELATKLFAGDRPGSRHEVIREYQTALTQTGAADKGALLFQKECGQCHRLGKIGTDVGPNLATIRHRSPGELLTQILDPNREVSPNFLEFAVALKDGRVATGLIAEESPNTITLRGPEKKEQTVSRDEIEEIVDTGKSLMPEGLEKKLSPAEMADLISYLLTTPLN